MPISICRLLRGSKTTVCDFLVETGLGKDMYVGANVLFVSRLLACRLLNNRNISVFYNFWKALDGRDRHTFPAIIHIGAWYTGHPRGTTKRLYRARRGCGFLLANTPQKPSQHSQFDFENALTSVDAEKLFFSTLDL